MTAKRQKSKESIEENINNIELLEKNSSTKTTSAKKRASTKKASVSEEKSPKKTASSKKKASTSEEKSPKKTASSKKKASASEEKSPKKTASSKKKASASEEKSPKKTASSKKKASASEEKSPKKTASSKKKASASEEKSPKKKSVVKDELEIEEERSVLTSEEDLVEHLSRLLIRPPAGTLASQAASSQTPLLYDEDLNGDDWDDVDYGEQAELKEEETFVDELFLVSSHEKATDTLPPKPPKKISLKPRSNKVLVKVFHPDVVEGGGYIEMEVPRDAIPPGAILISDNLDDEPPLPPKKVKIAPENPLYGLPPEGGILAAGRRLKEQGKLPKIIDASKTPEKNRKEKDTDTKQPLEKEDSTSSLTPEKSPSPATPSPATPSGLGSSFLQGLPPAKKVSLASDAKKNLANLFGDSTPTSSSTPKAPLMAPSAPTPSLPTFSSPSSASYKSGSTLSEKAPSTGEQIVIDGRLIETGKSAQQSDSVGITEVMEIPSSIERLRLYELKIAAGKHTLDAHLFLWKEGDFRLLNRVNDSDPRPRVWAEEGVRGLGMEEREKELQRRSMRHWWDALLQKGERPVAAFAASRAVRDSEQIALVYDPEYRIYRLYQRADAPLVGEYPLIMFSQGRLDFAFVSFDGVAERERLVPERMSEILGKDLSQETVDAAFSAIPCLLDGEALELTSSRYLPLFKDQLEDLFQFPVLELPDPLGGKGVIRLLLGLWEMSQNDELAQTLQRDALEEKAITLKASAGYLSDLVRRELWRMKEKPANHWTGYTPKEISEAIRIALRENHYNMQGFHPKKAGDYRYDAEKGTFEIVLRRKKMTHSLLLKGKEDSETLLGHLTIYGERGKEGFDPFEDYASLLKGEHWKAFFPELIWSDAWLTAPLQESRCTWSNEKGIPMTPMLRYMPDWMRGVSQALFLIPK